MSRASCQHVNFGARIDVTRILGEDGGEAVRFAADCTVRCAECGAKFGWRGVGPGMNSDCPTRSVDALELRAPLLSPTELELKGPLPGTECG